MPYSQSTQFLSMHLSTDSLPRKNFSAYCFYFLYVNSQICNFYFRVKFVGLFVILLAGYSTMTDLWRLLGDHSLSLVGIIILGTVVFS